MTIDMNTLLAILAMAVAAALGTGVTNMLIAGPALILMGLSPWYAAIRLKAASLITP